MTFTVKFDEVYYVEAEIETDERGTHAKVGTITTMGKYPKDMRSFMRDVAREIEDQVDNAFVNAYMRDGITTELSVEEVVTKYV